MSIGLKKSSQVQPQTHPLRVFFLRSFLFRIRGLGDRVRDLSFFSANTMFIHCCKTAQFRKKKNTNRARKELQNDTGLRVVATSLNRRQIVVLTWRFVSCQTTPSFIHFPNTFLNCIYGSFCRRCTIQFIVTSQGCCVTCVVMSL